MANNDWRDDEVRILRKWWPVVPISDTLTWARLIPRHPPKSIESKAYNLRIKKPRFMPPEWTEEEDVALMTTGRDKRRDWPGWKELLPGRTWAAILCRRSRLGLPPLPPGKPPRVPRDTAGRPPRRRHRQAVMPDCDEWGDYPEWSASETTELLRAASKMSRATGQCVKDCVQRLIVLGRIHDSKASKEGSDGQ